MMWYTVPMNEIQLRLEKLKKKRWTLAAIADRMGTKWFTVKRWQTGESYPNLDGAVIMAMDQLLTEKAPLKRRYAYNEPSVRD